jgi:hypothetical protein
MKRRAPAIGRDALASEIMSLSTEISDVDSSCKLNKKEPQVSSHRRLLDFSEKSNSSRYLIAPSIAVKFGFWFSGSTG